MHIDIFTLLVYLLPVIFMIHDFEEIIFKPVVTSVTSTLIQKHFPLPAIQVSRYLDSIPASAFTLAVAEEFLLISIVTIHALISGFYYLWIGIFIAFSIHICIHLIQSMVYYQEIYSMYRYNDSIFSILHLLSLFYI